MKENFDEIFAILKDSFPETEYREYAEQKELMKNEKYSIEAIVDDGKIIGFMAVWNLNGFDFIEHIAVLKEKRGMGIGSKMLSDYIEKVKKPIVLEVEAKDNDVCRKRIKFYERTGFKLNYYDYVQMPLRKNFEKIPMFIMSYPEKLSLREFNFVKDEIYDKVYGVKTTSN